MKKISRIVAILITVLPISLFAHDGHVHTGTFWENVVHFMFTYSYLFAIAFVAGYLLYRNTKKTQREKV